MSTIKSVLKTMAKYLTLLIVGTIWITLVILGVKLLLGGYDVVSPEDYRLNLKTSTSPVKYKAEALNEAIKDIDRIVSRSKSILQYWKIREDEWRKEQDNRSEE